MSADPFEPSLEPGTTAWRIALLYPPQGSWSEQDYLDLDAGLLVEFESGCVEVHDMPTVEHQRIVRFVFQLIAAAVGRSGIGEVLFAPLPVHLWSGKFREPDIVFIKRGRRQYQDYPDGADLVVEVVSQGLVARRRDLTTKVDEYAKAGITEYWIVDPEEKRLLAYRLAGARRYSVAEEYSVGDRANSQVIEELTFDVAEILNAGESV